MGAAHKLIGSGGAREGSARRGRYEAVAKTSSQSNLDYQAYESRNAPILHTFNKSKLPLSELRNSKCLQIPGELCGCDTE
jgi:hypothetical protein